MFARICVLGGLALAALTTVQGCTAATGPDDLDAETSEAAVDGALRKCPNLTVRRLTDDQRSTVSTTPVPTPNRAAITGNGRHVTCSGASNGDLEVGMTRWRDAFAPIKPRVTQRGNRIDLDPPLPLQETDEGWMSIGGFTCRLGKLKLEGAGFPTKNVEIYPTFEYSHSGSTFRAACRVHAKGPLSVIKERPADLVRARGDSFAYRCDLNDADRRNACSSLCSQQCTANVTPPVDVAGVNSCITDCTNRCASSAGCAPIFCTNDCPSSECAAENVCTSSSQCGSGRTCSGSGCCIPIIR